MPEDAWTPAYDADGRSATAPGSPSVTGLLDLSTGWPAGMRVIVRKERPHPGAQLRITDVDGHADHRVRHQHHPRRSSPTWNCATAAEPAARTASASPRTPACPTCRCTSFAQNRIWCAIVALAGEITAWIQTARPQRSARHPARRWEPKSLRLRLFTIAGRLAAHARGRRLHLSDARALGRPTRTDDHDPAAHCPPPAEHPPHVPTSTHDRPVEPATPSDLGPTVTPPRHNPRQRSTTTSRRSTSAAP